MSAAVHRIGAGTPVAGGVHQGGAVRGLRVSGSFPVNLRYGEEDRVFSLVVGVSWGWLVR